VLKVFISHSIKDQKPTEEVQQWLVAEGYTVFVDRDLRNGLEVGEDWQQRVNERLRWADAVVCVVTSAFLTSVRSAHYADLTEDPTKARAALLEALRRCWCSAPQDAASHRWSGPGSCM
jgi:hypothetical protein